MGYRYALIICIGTLGLLPLRGQDIHFSQYYYNYHNLNPSLTGQFDGDHRVTMNYRNQWLTVPVPYMSVSLFYDTKWRFRRKPGRLNFGLGMDYDQAGDSKMNLTKLIGSISYTHSFGSKHHLSLGVNPSIAQRRLNSEKLRWDIQWNGDRFDPSISSREQFNNTGDFFLDLGAGVNYEFYLTRRTKFQLNGAAFHLNKPNQSFAGQRSIKAELPIRYAGSGFLQIGIAGFMDIGIGAMYGQQDVYEETVASSILRFYINKTPGKVLNLLLGFNLRLEDAMIPHIGIEYKNWLISGSYDINTSLFKTATNKRGGPEITAQYIFKTVKSPGIYKKCPIH